MNTRLLQALRGQPTDRPPLWLMRQAGRYLPEYRALREKTPDFLEFCRNPEACCEAALQPLERYDLDASIVFSDILTLVDALGLGVTFQPHIGPIITHPCTPSSIPKLPTDVLSELRYVFDAVHLLKQALRDRLPVIGFSGSPWTLATYMLEGRGSKTFSQARAWVYREPKLTQQLLNHLATLIGQYLTEQVRAGADAIMLFDTWGGLLAHEPFKTFSLQSMARAIEVFRQDDACTEIPVTVYTKGGSPWLESLATLDAQAIGIDWSITLDQARQRLPNTTIQGNIDPTVLLGTPEAIQAEVRRARQAMRGSPHYIGNLGHGILPETPPEHVACLVEAWVDFK